MAVAAAVAAVALTLMNAPQKREREGGREGGRERAVIKRVGMDERKVLPECLEELLLAVVVLDLLGHEPEELVELDGVAQAVAGHLADQRLQLFIWRQSFRNQWVDSISLHKMATASPTQNRRIQNNRMQISMEWQWRERVEAGGGGGGRRRKSVVFFRRGNQTLLQV